MVRFVRFVRFCQILRFAGVRFVRFVDFRDLKKKRETDRLTDGLTDGPTDGQTLLYRCVDASKYNKETSTVTNTVAYMKLCFTVISDNLAPNFYTCNCHNNENKDT